MIVLYLSFSGARAFNEKRAQGIKEEIPVVVLDEDLVTDCDEKAWNDGVRPGDTVRQAKIVSPGCRIVRTRGPWYPKEVLDALSRLSPYVETTEDGKGVFVDVVSAIGASEIEFLLKISMGGTVPFRIFTGRAGSKLLARAVAEWLFRRYADRGRMPPGKTAWGEVDLRGSLFLASVDRGKEKAFFSGAALDSLWPVPPDILSTLRSLGLKKVGDLREASLSSLARVIGDWAYLVKEWAEGEDRTPVKALYPPPRIRKEASFQEPVLLTKELFLPVLAGLSAELIEKGIGFKAMKLTLSGDFPVLVREKKFVRPICSLEVMGTALEGILCDIFRGRDPTQPCPLISGFSLELEEIVSVQAEPVSLLYDGVRKPRKAIPLSLGLAIDGLERKFGGDALSWGPRGGGPKSNPEVVRREKMLSFWDPMRVQTLEQLDVAVGSEGS